MKKIFNLYFLRTLALILSGVIICFPFIYEIDTNIGLIMPEDKEWLPLILFTLVFILYLLEFITLPAWKRIIFFLFAALVFTFMGLESMGNMNAAIVMVSFIYMIILIVSLARTGVHLKSLGKEPNPNFGIQKTTSIKGKLSVAYVSKKHRNSAYLSLFLSILIGSCFLILFLYLKLYPILVIILYILIIIILYLLLSILINPLRKVLKQINDSAEFGRFERTLQEFYKEPLHPDMVSYLSTIQANYLFAVDMEKGLKLFEGITKPTFPLYLLIYTQVEVLYFINTGQWTKGKEAIQAAKEKYPKQASIFDTYRRTLQIFSTDDYIANIEAFYPITTKQKFLNLSNAYVLLMYFYSRNEKQKALSYADYILRNTTELLEYRKAADKVLYSKQPEEMPEIFHRDIPVSLNNPTVEQSDLPKDESEE